MKNLTNKVGDNQSIKDEMAALNFSGFLMLLILVISSYVLVRLSPEPLTNEHYKQNDKQTTSVSSISETKPSRYNSKP
jgi:hypothetical protein